MILSWLFPRHVRRIDGGDILGALGRGESSVAEILTFIRNRHGMSLWWRPNQGRIDRLLDDLERHGRITHRADPLWRGPGVRRLFKLEDTQ